MRPCVGSYRPVSSLISVVLPAPFSPTSASFCRARCAASTSRSAGVGRAGIGERHVLEAHAVARVGPAQLVAARLRRLRWLEELVQVREIQVVLVHAADRATGSRTARVWPCLNTSRYIVMSPSVIAPCDRASDDPRVRAVERQRAEQAEREAPHAAPQRERAVLAEQLVEDRRGSDRRNSGPRPNSFTSLAWSSRASSDLEVRLLARLGRAPAEQPKRVAGEPRLGDERRQAATTSTDHRPRREREQQPAVDRRARCAFCASPNARFTRLSGRARGLAPRARHAGRRTPSPRSRRGSASAPSRGSPRSRAAPSSARSSDSQTVRPRCAAASSTTRPSSSSTNASTGRSTMRSRRAGRTSAPRTPPRRRSACRRTRSPRATAPPPRSAQRATSVIAAAGVEYQRERASGVLEQRKEVAEPRQRGGVAGGNGSGLVAHAAV